MSDPWAPRAKIFKFEKVRSPEEIKQYLCQICSVIIANTPAYPWPAEPYPLSPILSKYLVADMQKTVPKPNEPDLKRFCILCHAIYFQIKGLIPQEQDVVHLEIVDYMPIVGEWILQDGELAEDFAGLNRKVRRCQVRLKFKEFDKRIYLLFCYRPRWPVPWQVVPWDPPYHFNVEAIREMIQKLPPTEGPIIRTRHQKDLPQNMRLIDLERQCLVLHRLLPEYPDSPPYVALSYVWETRKPGTFVLTQDRLQDLQEEGALRHAPVSRFIAEVMSLVKECGFRYLWIDRLCMIQNKFEDTEAAPGTRPTMPEEADDSDQFKKMHKVYQLSHLTIACCFSQEEYSFIPGYSTKRRQPAWPSTAALTGLTWYAPRTSKKRVAGRIRDASFPIKRFQIPGDPPATRRRKKSRTRRARGQADHVPTVTHSEPTADETLQAAILADLNPVEQLTWEMRHQPKNAARLAKLEDAYERCLHQNYWSTRGWTLQEELVSYKILYITPRVIVLKNSSIESPERKDDGLAMAQFTNESSVWIKAMDGTFEIRTESLKSGVDMSLRSGDPVAYTQLIRANSQRNLTKQTDNINCIEGILEVYLEKSSSEVLIHGIPLKWFEDCIMWRATGNWREGQTERTELPSWTWARVPGEVEYGIRTSVIRHEDRRKNKLDVRKKPMFQLLDTTVCPGNANWIIPQKAGLEPDMQTTDWVYLRGAIKKLSQIRQRYPTVCDHIFWDLPGYRIRFYGNNDLYLAQIRDLRKLRIQDGTLLVLERVGEYANNKIYRRVGWVVVEWRHWSHAGQVRGERLTRAESERRKKEAVVDFILC